MKNLSKTGVAIIPILVTAAVLAGLLILLYVPAVTMAAWLIGRVLERLTLARQTMFAGIQQLLPGEQLVWQDGQAEITRYWDYPADEDESLSYEEAVLQLHEGARAAVVDPEAT